MSQGQPSTMNVLQQQVQQQGSSLTSQVEQAVILHTMRLLQEAFDGSHGFSGILKLALVVGFDAIKAFVGELLKRLFRAESFTWLFAIARKRFWPWLWFFVTRPLGARGARGARGALGAHGALDAIGVHIDFKPHESFWRLLLLADTEDFKVSFSYLLQFKRCCFE